jgi:hypothetical protein
MRVPPPAAAGVGGDRHRNLDGVGPSCRLPCGHPRSNLAAPVVGLFAATQPDAGAAGEDGSPVPALASGHARRRLLRAPGPVEELR